MLDHLCVLGYGREMSGEVRGVDFAGESIVDGGVGHDLRHEGLEGRARCVCAGEKNEQDLGFDVFGVQGLAVVVASIDETDESVKSAAHEQMFHKWARLTSAINRSSIRHHHQFQSPSSSPRTNDP